MASCLVPNCISKTKLKSLQQVNEETRLGKSISFFKFPSCPKMQNIWHINLFEKQTTNIKASEESQICEKHFASTDFIEYNYNEVILKETAVPQLNIKPIDWCKNARRKLANIDLDVDNIDIDWLPIPSSINIDSDVKCRFCLKTKKEIILNSWRHIETPEFKQLYLQVTSSEMYISEKLPQFCCIFCYDRLNEAAATMLYFQECHRKWQKFLSEMPTKTIDSFNKEANKTNKKEVTLPEILDLNSDNEMETIENENDDNESCDLPLTNGSRLNEVISLEILDLNSVNISKTIENKNKDKERKDSAIINKVLQGESNKIKPIQPRIATCRYCAKVFQDARKCLTHMRLRHSEQLISACGYCNLKFRSKINLKAHIENHHKDLPLGTWKCLRCPGITYTRKESLGRHIYYKHPNLRDEAISVRPPAVSATCTICNKVSKSASLLNQHMYLVHRPRTIPCEECGQMFINQFKKKEHQLTSHTLPTERERLFVCEICGSNFITKNSFLNHQRTVHDDVDRRRRTSSAFATLPCTICDKKYVKLKNIKRHMEQVHKEISKQEWQLLLNRSCVRCNCIFDNEEYLQDHRQNVCNRTVK